MKGCNRCGSARVYQYSRFSWKCFACGKLMRVRVKPPKKK